MKKDYSLLRPFDLEAAKRGEKICWHEDGDTAVEVFFPKQGGVIPVFSGNDQCGIFTDADYYALKMSPLAWVEGRPMYKGDKLWHTGRNFFVVIQDRNGSNENVCDFPGHISPLFANDEYLTWTKPKQKREGWVNIYKDSTEAYIHQDRKSVDENSDECRVACLRIEWEE